MATILDLLMALNRDDLPPIPEPARPVPMAPAPTGNVPEYGGPSQVVEPPQAPLDTRIVQQYLAAQGPAPTPPAPLSRGQRIANALMGFGAGVQGQGPQFIEQLQQPQREYQRQLNAYNNQRSGIALQGLETAQRQQEQKTRRAQEVSDQQFQAEFQREARRLHLTDERELALFHDALETRRQREQFERASAEAERKEKVTLRRQVALQIDDRIKAYRDQGAKRYAEELARNDFRMALEQIGETVPPLSKAAEKANVLVQAKLQRALRLAQGGTGTGGGKLMAVLENGQTVPASQVNKDTGRVIIGGKPVKVAGYTGGGASSQTQTKAPQGQKADPLGIR